MVDTLYIAQNSTSAFEYTAHTKIMVNLLMERNTIIPVINILIIGTIYCEALSAFRGLC